MLWILDAGHGIETPGKRSPEIPPGIREYEFNRDIVRRVAEELVCYNIPFHVVCQDEHTKPIRDRVTIAKTMCEAWDYQAAFISIHSNAAGPGGWYEKARGVRAFTRMKPNPPSKRLGSEMTSRISTLSGLKALSTRDHITRKNKKYPLGILKNIPCPAVLMEIGFMTSLGDCDILSSDAGRRSIAEGIIDGILGFQLP